MKSAANGCNGDDLDAPRPKNYTHTDGLWLFRTKRMTKTSSRRRHCAAGKESEERAGQEVGRHEIGEQRRKFRD